MTICLTPFQIEKDFLEWEWMKRGGGMVNSSAHDLKTTGSNLSPLNHLRSFLGVKVVFAQLSNVWMGTEQYPSSSYVSDVKGQSVPRSLLAIVYLSNVPTLMNGRGDYACACLDGSMAWISKDLKTHIR
ncbi:hypothetical protein Tco_0970658 [Tanacetum coccineum]